MDREAMCRAWPRLAGVLKLLERWDGPRGIILESDAESAWEAASAIAVHLGGTLEKFEDHPIKRDDWRARVQKHTDAEGPQAFLLEKRAERLCVLILDLDKQPEWVQVMAKGPMDRMKPPVVSYCVIATADDADKIPANIRSHFTLVRKTGSRRGPRGA